MIKSERSMEAIRMKERLEAIRERALAQINETDSLDKLNDGISPCTEEKPEG